MPLIKNYNSFDSEASYWAISAWGTTICYIIHIFLAVDVELGGNCFVTFLPQNFQILMRHSAKKVKNVQRVFADKSTLKSKIALNFLVEILK